jgi:hypothetical protein
MITPSMALVESINSFCANFLVRLASKKKHCRGSVGHALSEFWTVLGLRGRVCRGGRKPAAMLLLAVDAHSATSHLFEIVLVDGSTILVVS